MSNPIRVALAQINPLLGDCIGNAEQIYQAAHAAHTQGASLVLTPELALTGYPPEDLLLRPAFIADTQKVLDHLCQRLAMFEGLAVVVGHPSQDPVGLHNTATVLEDGKVIARYYKQVLPNNEVFDEKRYFVSGNTSCVFSHHGLKLGLLLCEDIWHAEPAANARANGAELLLVMNASPYHLEKDNTRLAVLKERTQDTGLAVVYLNMVGGQDELVFDGGSCALNSKGELVIAMPQFKEALTVLSIQDGQPLHGEITPPLALEAQVYSALVMGTRDYVRKNRFPGVIIGLSGGVDSALVLAIAVDALGADHVRAVMMPSPYTAEISWIDACELAKNLGVQYDEIPISQPVDAIEGVLQEQFANRKPDATEENIQARVRGTLLMALSNKTGRLVLTTGNKSEMAVGYCTLYGDMAGGFAVIKDVAKTLVYRLCHWKNAQPNGGLGEVIPMRILPRAPSAELRPDQKDQDSLPEYAVLDEVVERYMENDQSIDDIVAAGFERDDVERVARLIKINEYKRRQAPIGIRVSNRSFGKDWRYPVTSQFRA